MRQVFYYKMRQFYYKMRQLLQNATILLQNATFITNLRQYNQWAININLFKQINIDQMFEKIQMILMMKTSMSNNRISWLN